MDDTTATTRAARPIVLLSFGALAAVVIVATSVAAGNGRVGAIERSVFEAVNGLPDALHWPMWVLQLMG